MSRRKSFESSGCVQIEGEEDGYDALTGLPDRTSLERRIERCLAQKGRPFSLIVIDIDNFRSFNDAYGYAVGDAIIARFGRYLQTSLSTGVEMVGRVGSEEYLAIVDGADRDVLDGLTSDLLSVRLTIDGEGPSGESTSVSLTAGAGVVSWDGEAALTPAALIHQAEVALRKAKQLGRSRRYAFETDDAEFARLREDMRLSMELSVEIGDALERGEFEAFFQPLFRPSNGRIVGAEALARWRHPSRGLVSPAVFIPPLERSGAIVDLDLAIFEQCCRFLRDRLDKGAVIVPLNCNFSRLHFLDDSFADTLKGIVDRYAVPPSYLCAEITESAFVEDFDTVIGQVKRLHEHGFSVAMDDFGSGYSSLGMLQNLPIDEAKIDQLFFQRDLSDFRNATVVYSMANIAKVLGLVVVCEGIETAEQVEFVKGIGCDIAQGFFFSRPVDEASFGGLLERALAHEPQKRSPLRKEDARSFIVRLFDHAFVRQDLDAFADCCFDDVQWQDRFEEGCFSGIDAVRAHLERAMSGRELSIAYKAITVNELSGDLVAVSGEAVFTGDVDYQGVFYFGASCLATDAGVLLTKMKIDRVNRSGHSHRSLQMAAMDMERLDEGPALDQFYGVVPVGIIRYDLSGDMLITYMNQAMFDILGYTKEQFYGEVGANLRMIVHPDDLDHLYKKSVEMIETGESEPFSYRFIRRDGSVARVLYRQCNLPGIDGRPVTQGMYIDLDEAERYLTEGEGE